MDITLCGTAREVTRTCYVVRVAGATVALDFGMFQGRRRDAGDTRPVCDHARRLRAHSGERRGVPRAPESAGRSAALRRERRREGDEPHERRPVRRTLRRRARHPRDLRRANQIPAIPIILDSPLAIAATTIFATNSEAYDQSERLVKEVDLLNFGALEFTRDASDGEPAAQDAFAATLRADGYAVTTPERGTTVFF
ncbi:MAG: hypothetical protein ACREPM_05080 [Gemmatimonadaceae bacterium]